VVGYIIIALLQIVCRVCQSKSFVNRSIIGKDMDKSKVPRFLWPAVYIHVNNHISIALFGGHRKDRWEESERASETEVSGQLE